MKLAPIVAALKVDKAGLPAPPARFVRRHPIIITLSVGSIIWLIVHSPMVCLTGHPAVFGFVIAYTCKEGTWYGRSRENSVNSISSSAYIQRLSFTIMGYSSDPNHQPRFRADMDGTRRGTLKP